MPRGDVLANKITLPVLTPVVVEIDGATGVATFGADTEINQAWIRALDHRIPGALRMETRKLGYSGFSDPGTSKTVDIWTPAAVPGVTNSPIVVDVFAYLNATFLAPASSAIELDVGEDSTPDTDRFLIALDVMTGPALTYYGGSGLKGADLSNGTTIILPFGQKMTATLRITGDTLDNLDRGEVTVLWSYYHMPTLP